MKGEVSGEAWDAFDSCWVSVYTAFPNVLSHDFASYFRSQFFQKTCEEFGIATKEILCESHYYLGVVKKYHEPLKKVYKKLKEARTKP